MEASWVARYMQASFPLQGRLRKPGAYAMRVYSERDEKSDQDAQEKEALYQGDEDQGFINDDGEDLPTAPYLRKNKTLQEDSSSEDRDYDPERDQNGKEDESDGSVSSSSTHEQSETVTDEETTSEEEEQVSPMASSGAE